MITNTISEKSNKKQIPTEIRTYVIHSTKRHAASAASANTLRNEPGPSSSCHQQSVTSRTTQYQAVTVTSQYHFIFVPSQNVSTLTKKRVQNCLNEVKLALAQKVHN